MSRSAEEWRAVPGFEGYYEVSDHGRVRSLDRIVVHPHGLRRSLVGRLRKLTVINGYMRVTLGKLGQQRVYLVHQLVMAAFIGPCPEGLEILHGDDNPGNNNLANLKYGTHQENLRDSVVRGRHAYSARNACDSGHEFTPENTFTRRPSGARGCRECQRAYQREYNARCRARKRANSRNQLTPR